MKQLRKIFTARVSSIDVCIFCNLQTLCNLSHFHGTKIYGKGFAFTSQCLCKTKNAKASFALKFAPNFLLLFGQGRREGQGKMDIAGDRAEMEE